MPPTPTRQLADSKLDGRLDEIVESLRSKGESWRAIAKHLLVEHDIDVSNQTLMRWYEPEAPQ